MNCEDQMKVTFVLTPSFVNCYTVVAYCILVSIGQSEILEWQRDPKSILCCVYKSICRGYNNTNPNDNSYIIELRKKSLPNRTIENYINQNSKPYTF